MGYTTDFGGSFKINKPLDPETKNLLEGINRTRRMARKGLDKKYGVEGEFYCEDRTDCGQGEHPSIVDYNRPPKTQPGLWCHWTPNADGTEIEWDGGEKFYAYVEWIEYLIEKILAPRGYKLTGQVEWKGEDSDDLGLIVIKNNVVKIKQGKVVYK